MKLKHETETGQLVAHIPVRGGGQNFIQTKSCGNSIDVWKMESYR